MFEPNGFVDKFDQIRQCAIQLHNFSRLEGPKKWLIASTPEKLMDK